MIFARFSLFKYVPATSRIINMLKYTKVVETYGNKVKSVSSDDAWYTEHSDATFEPLYQILIKWSQYFVHHDNIWRIFCRKFFWYHCRIDIMLTMHAASNRSNFIFLPSVPTARRKMNWNCLESGADQECIPWINNLNLTKIMLIT